jgi:hypothetical protein
MDGERFDAVLRRAVGDGSRRGILRVGVGTLAVSALGLVGLHASDDAAAKHKHKKKKKKPSRPKQCTADRPVICGDGCCGGSFPQCCNDLIETSGHICAPSSATCCAPSGGGGWCGTGFHCCPPISDFPGGYCCPTAETCCFTTADCPGVQTCDPGGGCCS